MAVVLDFDLCTGCGRCVGVCPAGAIVLDELLKKAVIDDKVCIDCGICIESCKKGALSFSVVDTQKAAYAGAGSRVNCGMERQAKFFDLRTGRGKGFFNGKNSPGSGGSRNRSSGRGCKGSGSGTGSGVSGKCICPSCGRSMPHEAGVPCAGIQCPGCGASMIRS